jgi:hypothetical protein
MVLGDMIARLDNKVLATALTWIACITEAEG